MPAYHDDAAVEALENRRCAYPAGKNVDWYGELDKLKTAKHRLFDVAVGLLSLYVAFAWVCTANTAVIDHTVRIVTPKSASMFVSECLVVLMWVPGGMIFSYQKDFVRGDFPHCADSLGIPLSGIMVATFVLLPACLVVASVLSLTFRQLPLPLVSPRKSGWATLLQRILTVAVLVAGGALTVITIDSPDSAVAGALAWLTYLTVAALSALNRRQLSGPTA